MDQENKITCIKAIHEMEERYSKLLLNYYNKEQKEKIFYAINDAIAKFHLTPMQTIIPSDKFTGQYCLEFHDDYDKKAGEFFEYILHTLDISHCEMG